MACSSLPSNLFKHKLYIAACREDDGIVSPIKNSVMERLDSSDSSDRTLKHIYHTNEENTPNISQLVDEINNSERVLLVLTKDYTGDEWRCHEVCAIEKKGKHLTFDFVLVLLRTDCEKDEKVRRILGLLRNARIFSFKDTCDQITTDSIVNHLTDEFEISGLPVYRRITEDTGATMANSYFFGYLKIILPGLAERIKRCIDIPEEPNDRNVTTCFLIIIPCSLKGCPKLNDFCEAITEFKTLPYEAKRGGQDRDYKTPVMKIANTEGTTGLKELYFAAEVPAILIDVYDMQCDANTVNDKSENRKKRGVIHQFYRVLEALLSSDPELVGKCKIIFYNDVPDRHQPTVSFEDLMLEAVRDLIRDEATNPRKYVRPSQIRRIGGTGINVRNGFQTFKELPTIFQVEERPLQYFRVSNCGDGPVKNKALIINNRTDNRQQEDEIKQLLCDLDFEVFLRNDLTYDLMQSYATQWSNDFTHRRRNATIVFILTYGYKGSLWCTGNSWIKFKHFARDICNCGALEDKPKMLFVDAPQHPAQDEPSAVFHSEEEATPSPSVQVSGGPHFPDLQDSQRHRERLVPASADTICSFSAEPGSPSDRGSYLRHLVSEITNYRSACCLEDLLRRTKSAVVGELGDSQNPLHRPFYFSSMRHGVVL